MIGSFYCNWVLWMAHNSEVLGVWCKFLRLLRFLIRLLIWLMLTVWIAEFSICQHTVLAFEDFLQLIISSSSNARVCSILSFKIYWWPEKMWEINFDLEAVCFCSHNSSKIRLMPFLFNGHGHVFPEMDIVMSYVNSIVIST